jgi:hypothetical protein
VIGKTCPLPEGRELVKLCHVRPRHFAAVFAFIALVAFPATASANAGTPLMWAGFLHLTIGNAVIGIFEGFLIARFWKLPMRSSSFVMIGANYISAWVGGVLIDQLMVEHLDLYLNNAWRAFWLLAGVTYIVTLLLEWPFVAFCFRRNGVSWAKRSLCANLAVQTVSYLILFGWYWAPSGTSLYTEFKVVPVAELGLSQDLTVYYLSHKDGHVYRRKTNKSIAPRVAELRFTNSNDRLFVQLNTGTPTTWNLMALGSSDSSSGGVPIPVLTNLTGSVVADSRNTPEGTPFNFGDVPRLAGATNSSWKFFTGFWPKEGLRGESDGKRMGLSFETPFIRWAVRNAVHLPSDKVLFQLGDSQICIVDPESRRVAFLCRGRGPVAVIEPEKQILSKTLLP